MPANKLSNHEHLKAPNSAAVTVVIHPGAVNGFITVLIGGGGALLLYVIVARALRLDELNQLMRMVGGRFGRRG